MDPEPVEKPKIVEMPGPAKSPQAVEPVRPARKPACKPMDQYETLIGILGAIQRIRRRRLFALVADPITDEIHDEIYKWKQELRSLGDEQQLDVLIHSGGGALTACYMVARLFARCSKAWEALVPERAASGATLICLGSREVVLSDVACLSPLDPQVVSKRREKFFATERQSPLEAFQAARYLRELALSSLDVAMRFLLDHGIAAPKALEAATQFAGQLVQPILGKIEPYDLGAFALDSNLALVYCHRIANPADSSRQTQRSVQYRSLVEGYPAHEFAIDLAEARALEFNANAPSPELEELFDQLRAHLPSVETFVGFVPDDQGSPL